MRVIGTIGTTIYLFLIDLIEKEETPKSKISLTYDISTTILLSL
jgi:hypothetical protein